MRIVFFGTARFAVPALGAVRDLVAIVVSQPDRPSGRGMKLQQSPVKERALELGLSVETPEKCRAPEFVERIAVLEPDVLLVAAYGQILSQSLLDTAKYGGINLHGSILPKYRGAAPIQRAIQNGETETGITLMQMDKGMDTGDIIAIERTPISPLETYGELESRLGELAAGMAADWVPRIAAADYPRAPQDQDGATYAPKVEKAEAEIDPQGEAKSEYDRFRAFTPSPGAFLKTQYGILRIDNARPTTHDTRPTNTPGTILEAKASLVIALGDGALELVEVRPEGKKRMSGRDFANGMRLVPGMRITP